MYYIQIPKSEGGVRLLVPHGDSIIIGTTVNSMLSITLSKKNSPLKDVVLDQVPMTQVKNLTVDFFHNTRLLLYLFFF